ncbi:MAG: hypothetical protein HYX80_07015 [Chloroflexi bacterium]|nr:hypothetical protein [Chloroflexota bacterium]
MKERSDDNKKERNTSATSPGRRQSVKQPVREKDLISRKFLETEQRNRQIISHNLYEAIGQSLAVLKLSIDRIEKTLINEIESASAETQANTDRIIEQLRLISDALLPTTLDDFGLLRTLENLFHKHAESTGIRVRFHNEGLEQRMPLVTEAAIYRIVRDTLLHIVSQAETVQLRVNARVRNNTVSLSISATGAGFDTPEDDGIQTALRQMATLLGGRLKIETLPERLRLTSRLPVAGGYGEGLIDPVNQLLQKPEDQIGGKLKGPREKETGPA